MGIKKNSNKESNMKDLNTTGIKIIFETNENKRYIVQSKPKFVISFHFWVKPLQSNSINVHQKPVESNYHTRNTSTANIYKPIANRIELDIETP